MGHNPRHSTYTSASKDWPLSLDFPIFNGKSSMIYSLLPSAVQDRLQRLGSIRKSACVYASGSEIEDRRFSNGSKSSSNAYGSEIVLRNTQLSTEPVEFASYFQHRSAFRESKSSDRQFLKSEGFIDWKFANQGLHLISLSAEESTTISQNPIYGNTSFARQLYLHGLTYVLRGLPRDLSSEEQLSIQSSLPRTILITQEISTNDQLPASSQGNLRPAKPSPPSSSILHRILASTIVQLFILFQFLLPYFKLLLRRAYKYERTHHISEKVLASSIDVADIVGRQSLAVTAALYGMGNGKVGQALTEGASWLIEGITGGIHDGVGEGLNIITGGSKGEPVHKLSSAE